MDKGQGRLEPFLITGRRPTAPFQLGEEARHFLPYLVTLSGLGWGELTMTPGRNDGHSLPSREVVAQPIAVLALVHHRRGRR